MSDRKKIHHVGITTLQEVKNPKLLANLIHCLRGSKKEVYISDRTAEGLSKNDPILSDIHKLPNKVILDLLIVLGGDGTILSAVHKLHSLDTYIFGINEGHLGFLSEVQPDNLESTCLTIWDANYTLDERMLLKIEIERKGENKEYRALNELVISQSGVARLVELPTKVGGDELSTFRADGLIIATPTGSTAYNLSAGGPILYPRLEAMIITPIAPFSFMQKPLVLPADKTVSIDISDCNKGQMIMTIDGQTHESLQCGDTIKVSRHSEKAKFLRLPEENYFKTIREKLKWGERL